MFSASVTAITTGATSQFHCELQSPYGTNGTDEMGEVALAAGRGSINLQHAYPAKSVRVPVTLACQSGGPDFQIESAHLYLWQVAAVCDWTKPCTY